MTKKNIFMAIAKNVEADDTQLSKAMEQALKQPKERLEQVYEYYQQHPEQSGFCLCLLTGIQFPNPTTTPEQRFEASKEALKRELEGILTEAKERIEEFVADSLERYGDFRVWDYSPEHFSIALFNGEKPVFGAHWDVYVTKQYHSRGEKGYEVICNIGTAGSFPVGQGHEREKLYMAFARFMNDINDWGLRKYLIRVQEKADKIWHRFYRLCDQYKQEPNL